MSLQKYKEDFLLFLEAGFVAINQADEDCAVKLFKACQLLNPKNTLSKIGMGYLHLHKLELKQAINFFEEALKEEPKNEMAKAFLGIAMTMTPTKVSAGEKLLMETNKSPDKMVKQLSNTALDFVDKFIKKESSPIEAPMKPKSKRA